MSMLSRWTIGAMASKKASASSPVCARIAAASAGEVRGPVAMIDARPNRPAASRRSPRAGSRSAARRQAPPRPRRRSRARSTASAPPAGTRWASAARRTSEPAAPHLLMQQAHRVVLGIVGAEGVGADQFGQAIGVMRLGASAAAASRAAPRRRRPRPPARPPRCRPSPPPMMWMGDRVMAQYRSRDGDQEASGGLRDPAGRGASCAPGVHRGLKIRSASMT